ncbi:hypothetical protein LUW76_21155 [Actinomadura madurae]|uniref:hypothetical protein n=1 Tax=Actinomadura madurae TaxID=1993 RepID=UPI002027446A|nr:hypothetical protein [Actinomadura madurae]URM96639.1 hypothetical protein LUW76_21155 [Actinomadura madurae]
MREKDRDLTPRSGSVATLPAAPRRGSRSIRRYVAPALLTGTVLVLAAVPAGGATAAGTAARTSSARPASPADCANWWKPGPGFDFVAHWHRAGKTSARRVQLRVGRINGIQHGWAHIGRETKRGDAVWMDVTRGGGRWLQCGPFVVTADGQEVSTPAARTEKGSSLRFRACSRTDGETFCNQWW